MKRRTFGTPKPTLRQLQNAMNLYAPTGGMKNPPAFMNETPRAERVEGVKNKHEEKIFMNGLFKLLSDYYKHGVKKIWLRKNSNGVARSMNGQAIIKYGLGTGVSDGVGWVSRVIRPEDVGRTVAIFLAVEGKLKTGVVSDGQEAFINQVNRDGGIAFVAYDTDGVDSVIDRIEKAETGIRNTL